MTASYVFFCLVISLCPQGAGGGRSGADYYKEVKQTQTI